VKILQAVADGIDGGANVIGYTYWTLNYDYEWNDGWTQNMGLYTVKGFGDGNLPGGAPGATTDFTRVPLQPMVDVFTEIARGNGVSSHLIGHYGSP
jgi:beta-glucosidase/6-phospho-beta-glucosidase/beta-galactosidase